MRYSCVQELRDCHQGEGRTENRVSPRQRQKHQVCQLHVQAKIKDMSPVSRKLPYAGMLTPHCRADHSEWRPPSTLRVTRTRAWHCLPQLRPLHLCYRHAPCGTLTIYAYAWVCCVIFNGQDDAFFCFSTALEVIQEIFDKQMNKRMIV